MSMILVVDDMTIFREPIAASLRLAGYQTRCASNGQEARDLLGQARPDLILLDIAMPVMDGLTFLKHLRAAPETASIPVILLTALSERQQVIDAAALGVKDYLLKSRFKLNDLLARVASRLESGAKTAPEPAGPTSLPPQSEQTAPPASKPPPAPAQNDPPAQIPQLMTREQCIMRAQTTLEGKSISGVVSKVMSLAASPRGEVSELAQLISRDPVLSARLLNAANSAAYASRHGPVSSVADAVRQIGCAAVRNIAMTVGIFDSVQHSAGFNPLRIWQHSLAVAQLCEMLSEQSREARGESYLVGLCHDLGEIFFRTQFAEEYKQVLELQQKTGQRLAVLEREVLGITHRNLVVTILRALSLPDAVRLPIEILYQDHGNSKVLEGMAGILRIANLYANGLLLSSGSHSRVAPITKSEWRAAIGQAEPTRPDGGQFHSTILSLTMVLARATPAEERLLTTPLFPRSDARIWLAREQTFSSFCPIAAALESLAMVDVFDHLPAQDELPGYAGLVVVSAGSDGRGFAEGEIAEAAKALANPTATLWLSGQPGERAGQQIAPCQPWPIALEDLAAFVRNLPVAAQPATLAANTC